MGGLSINLLHLPHPGGVQEQGAKLLSAFDVIREELKRRHIEAMKRTTK